MRSRRDCHALTNFTIELGDSERSTVRTALAALFALGKEFMVVNAQSDLDRPEFAAECRRQSKIASQADQANMDDWTD